MTLDSCSGLSLTALLITYNEEDNIQRTLDGLVWLSQILLIDSGSTDSTLAIARQYPAVKILHRPFDNFANQCNFGLDRVTTHWVLSLDADYRITADLAREIMRVLHTVPEDGIAGFSIPFRYCVWGKPLRGTLLPPRTVLYRAVAGRYFNSGHGHRLTLNGKVAKMKSFVLHDDRKPLTRWLESQYRYMKIEASHLACADPTQLSPADRLRKHTPFAPFAVLLLCLLWKGGVLDGWRGWFYAMQRMYAELLLLLFLLDSRALDENF